MRAKVIVWGRYAALIIVLLGMSFSAGGALAKPATTAQAEISLQAGAPDLPNAPDASWSCPTINNIAAFSNRIHLRCSSANGSILYYAYPNDPAHAMVANQILAVANTAFALGSHVYVYYNSDSILNPSGCNTSDCRGLTGISILP